MFSLCWLFVMTDVVGDFAPKHGAAATTAFRILSAFRQRHITRLSLVGRLRMSFSYTDE